MDLLTIERIKLLHPKVREEVLHAYKHINNKLLGNNVRLRFTSTLRNFSEQESLYAMGRTKPGKMVTFAKQGHSMHNYGLAFDIVLLINNDSHTDFETAVWNIDKDFDNDTVADWLEAVAYFKKIGWSWGGEWKTFKDYPHFQKTFNYSAKQLLEKYNANDTFTENNNGKILTWVNL